MIAGRALDVPLVASGFAFSTDPDRLGWLTPSDPSRPREELWEQYRAQGYLWLKGLLDRDHVLDFRRRYFEAFEPIGMLKAGTDPQDAIYNPDFSQRQSVPAKLREIVQWASYEAFCLSAPVWQFYEKLLGGTVYLHVRRMLRHNYPGVPGSTPAHYDLTYLRAGTDRVHTSWIPIGDAPVEMGGLVYLEGSDAWGRQMEAEFAAKNADLSPEERINAYNRNMNEGGWITKDLPSLAERLNTRWLVADYEAGDMVIHSAYMIHGASENVDPRGRMRLSTDIRYQLVSDAIDSRWSNRWTPDDNL